MSDNSKTRITVKKSQQSSVNKDQSKDQTNLKFKGEKPGTKPPAKRFQPDSSNSSVSDTSASNLSGLNSTTMDDLSGIQVQLEAMTTSISDLRGDLKNMLNKKETEDLIKNIMARMEKKMDERIESMVQEKTKVLSDKLDSVEFENKQLKDRIIAFENKTMKKMIEIEENVSKNFETSREASRRSNYNEQYSRKNNVKIMDIPEDRDEDEEKLANKVGTILQSNANVTLRNEDVVAMHRIPSKKGNIRPVLIKLRNNNAKSTIMRKRRPMKEKGNKLVDDVTKLNQGLINRLINHGNIQNAWYFNGSVYGLTACDERIKFDIYDNINSVIEDFRQRRHGLGRPGQRR